MGIQMRKIAMRNLMGNGMESDNKMVHKITPGIKTSQNSKARKLKKNLYKASSMFDKNIDEMG